MTYLLSTAIEDNHLKIFKNSLRKKVQKGFLYTYFGSLTLAVFNTVKNSIFQDNFSCNFFIRSEILLHSEAHSGPRQILMIEPFAKLAKIF